MRRRSLRILQRRNPVIGRKTWNFLSHAPAEIRDIVYGFLLRQHSKVPIRKRAFANSVLTVAGIVKKNKRKDVANNLFAFKTQLAFASKQAWNELYARLKQHARSTDATLTITITNFDFTDPIALYDLIMNEDNPPEDDVHPREYGIMAKVLIRMNITGDFAPYATGALESIQKWCNLIDSFGDDEVDCEIGKLENMAPGVKGFIINLDDVFKHHQESSKISNVSKTWFNKRQSSIKGESHLIGFYEPIEGAAQHRGQDSEYESDQAAMSDASDDDFEPDEADIKESDLNMEFDEGEDDDMESSLEALKDLDAEMPDSRYEAYSAGIDRGFYAHALLS